MHVIKLVKSVITKLVLIAGLLFSSLYLNAQSKEVQTLMGSSGDVRIGGYGSFEIRGSQLDGGFHGLLLGGRGGAILNNSFALGFGGYGLLPTRKVNPPSYIAETGKKYHLSGGYGGLLFEYINSSHKLVHFATNTLLGVAGITYTDITNREERTDIRFPKSVSFVIEPCAEIELNVSKVFRISLGVSYRYAPNFSLKYNGENNKNAFNGFSINLGFKFGEFVGQKINSEKTSTEP
ncbi:MAG: hypothetical protein GX879_09105 [Bacteroidales bacterium]|nr:hypothetical protein [Bacteroidales bacterium]